MPCNFLSSVPWRKMVIWILNFVFSFWMPRVKPVISHPIDHQGLPSCCILAQRRLKCVQTPTIWLHTLLTQEILSLSLFNLIYYLPHLISLTSWHREGSKDVCEHPQFGCNAHFLHRNNFHFHFLISYIIYRIFYHWYPNTEKAQLCEQTPTSWLHMFSFLTQEQLSLSHLY